MASERLCPRCGAPLTGGDACPACGYQPGTDATATVATGEPADAPPGHERPARIGPYKILSTLGEGGMGVVYLAEQTVPIQRRVALKLIKVGMDTRRVVARFEAERQALALMDHPNIASVFDASATEDGRPYFVMEYIAGVPITDYCNTNRLSTRARLLLFTDVCAAVQHAHQKGVIHRDLKPSNVLVMVKDGQPVPKIIDFGVAKATHQRLTEETLFTEHGIMVGTPAYMSPEQAEMSGLDVDATTDIYSLGVLLYELMVGGLPFEPARLRRAGYAEIRRIIREEDPPKPSVRLSGLGMVANEVARQRRTDPPTLGRELRGDLDWITLKALEKDRTRRYPSASELAADLTRHLHDEPVVARPVSAAYRVRKFVKRHRIAVVSAAGVLAALVGALVVTTTMYMRAEGARQRADYQAYVANLAAADAHLRAGEHLRAERRLLASGLEFRDHWEWRHLYAMTDTSAATAYLREDPPAAVDICRRQLAVAPDGRQVMHAGGHLVQAWNVERSTVATLYSTEHDVLAIDPVGRLVVVGIAAASPAGERFERLEVVDLSNGTVVSALTHPGAFAAAFDGSGGRVATASADSVFVWDSRSGMRIGERIDATIPRPELVNFKLAPDGSSVVQHPNVWLTGSRQRLELGVDGDFPGCAVFSPDAQRVVTLSIGGLEEWEVSSGRLLRQLREGATLSQLALSPDARFLATGRQSDPAIQLLDVTSAQIVATLLTTESVRARDLAFSPDGQRLFAAFGTDRPHIRMWEMAKLRAAGGFPMRSRIAAVDMRSNLELMRQPSLSADSVPLAAANTSRGLSPDGRQVAFGMPNQVGVWDVSNQILARQAAIRQARALALSGDPGRLLAGGSDGLFFSDLDGRPPTLLDSRAITTVALGDDGRLAAAGRSAGGVGVWSLPSTSEQFTIDSTPPATALRVDASRMQLVMATRDEYLRDSVELWDVKNRTRVWKADVPRVEALSFNAECGKIAIGSTGTDAQLQVLDATTGSVLLTMPASESRIRSLAFDRNCRRLAQATDAGIDLWDTSTGVHLLTLRIPAGASGRPPPIVQAVQFSQDGQQLHALDSQWIRVYDAAPAYHPGAYELVNRLFNELFLSEDVLARLRSDASLDPGLRAAAIGLAEKYGDSPSVLGRESQRISVRPDQSPERYLRARRMAELCVQLNPTSGASQLSLGMALYRAGDYPAAAEALGRADRLPARAAQTKGAFLALTLARLGRADDARAELDKLRAEVDKRTLPLPPGFLKELPPQVAAQLAPRPDPYPEVTALMKEAEGLLAGKAR